MWKRRKSKKKSKKHDHSQSTREPIVKLSEECEVTSSVDQPTSVSAHSGAFAVSNAVAHNTFAGPVTFKIVAEHPADTVTADLAQASTSQQCDAERPNDTITADNVEDSSMQKCKATVPWTLDGGTRIASTIDIKAMFKSDLAQKYELVFEGNSEKKALMDIYTEVYFVDFCGLTEHEMTNLEKTGNKPSFHGASIKLSELFQVGDERKVQKRVLTLGIAGIGKTVSVQKFILDWARGKENQNIDYIFPLPFRQMNAVKDGEHTIIELLKRFFPAIEPLKSLPAGAGKVMFILDGLDESRFEMDFEVKMSIKVNDKAKVETLMSHLIQGTLLPSAFVWITSRPAAAKQIPEDSTYIVTEVQGFSDTQRNEYFRKKFGEKAGDIMSNIKQSRTLHNMCYIPVFSWILANVIQAAQDTHTYDTVTSSTDTDKIPVYLTEMYTKFVLLQVNQIQQNPKKKGKWYHKIKGNASTVSAGNTLLKLGRLAFLQLLKGNLVFDEKDLRACKISPEEATVYSGLCTQIFKKESGVFHSESFSFVHLSVQEFLAAIYCFLEHTIHGRNPFHPTIMHHMKWWFKHSLYDLIKVAVNKAIRSSNGQLDLFLRFLFGLSLQTPRHLLKEIFVGLSSAEQALDTLAKNRKGTSDRTELYVKEKIKQDTSINSSINLFYCLKEINSESLVSEVKSYLTSFELSVHDLSPLQWSALAFVLCESEEVQKQFELQRFRKTDEGLKRMQSVVNTTCQALLACCELTKNGCEILALILQNNSHLRMLDLSNNDLKDAGVKELCNGLCKPNCKLEKLWLSGCLITDRGCDALASALTSNPSHLRELDLSYNNIGSTGQRQLDMFLQDGKYKLEKLNLDNNAQSWLESGLRKYACQLTLDANTANVHLLLSKSSKRVTFIDQRLSYPDHPERFKRNFFQVLSRNGQSGRCYWEAKWTGSWAPVIGMAYKSIERNGRRSKLEKSDKSWSLIPHGRIYTASHNYVSTNVNGPSTCTIGVYLDWPAGTLSFYAVSASSLTHLHTFHCTFTEPLFAAFSVYKSSVTLC